MAISREGMNNSFRVTIGKDEKGHVIFYSENKQDDKKMEGIFIDWVARGYFEPSSIGEHGELFYRVTDWGKEHIEDIIPRNKVSRE